MVLVWIAFLRVDFSISIVFERSSTDTPTVLQVHRHVVDPGGVAAAVGVPAVGLLERRAATRRAASTARSRPYANAVLGGDRRLLHLADGDLGPERRSPRVSPVPTAGPGPQPAAPPPGDDVPPADALLGLRRLLDPVRVRGRRADHAPARTPTGSAPRAASRCIAWTFLGCGILLGALWSYTELGWGGYWAWDPVENASLMPWLTGTAFLHSVMIQEKRGMLKIWNVVADRSGRSCSSLLGTFLVRSGRARLDPRVRRLDARHAVPVLHRHCVLGVERRCSCCRASTT